MKKLLIAVTGLALVALSAQTFAAEDKEHKDIGKKIYDRAFGRGCGTCHDIKSNPQLPELIRAGQLDDHKFYTVLKEGKGGMPKAIEEVNKVGSAAKLSEKEAVDALYEYLKDKK